jgi:two-component system, NtrC family, sensor kinase
VLLMQPHVPSVAMAVGCGCLVGGFAVIARDGRDLWFALEWGALSVAIGVLALLGSSGFRRVWLSEVEAQRAHGEALERLAESERRRARAERLALVGRLAAGVAHEINNPLSFVKSNVQFLQREPSAEERADALRESLEGIERIAQIVGDLRSLARDAPEDERPFPPASALEEAWRLASVRLRSVRVQRDEAGDLPPVRGSRRLLVQALVNLLANAAEAAEGMPDPGRRWVALRAAPERGGVAITVEDGGPGLSEEALRHLFEPFFSTKGTRGTGLGLALVREHAARCGGTVEGANRPGAGAAFTLWLPRAEVTQSDITPLPVQTPGRARRAQA